MIGVIAIAYLVIGIVFTVVMLIKDGDIGMVSNSRELVDILLGIVLCVALWPIGILMLLCGGDDQ